MKDWNDIIELNNDADINDADIKARERLADELHCIDVNDAVVIWPDEKRAYLDSGNPDDYRRLAGHFKVEFDTGDFSLINDALLDRYEELFDQARYFQP